MQLPTVYDDEFLISGIMCFEGCGKSVEQAIRNYLVTRFPNAKIYISSGPVSSMHRYRVTIQSESKANELDLSNLTKDIEEVIKAKNKRFDVKEDVSLVVPIRVNWVNIFINLVAIISIVVLSILFPPSLLLSIGLGLICFSATLFTAREYIFDFLASLSSKNFSSMSVTVSLGWLLAMTHAIYHMQFMPAITSFAMTFMNFIMPLILVTIVNVMDEIKRQIQKKAHKIFLNGIKSLFPKMQDNYFSSQLSEKDAETIRNKLQNKAKLSLDLQSYKYAELARHTLCKDMLIKVNRGECFPVDGQIVFGNTYVDQSILDGEPAMAAESGMEVKSGCINLWRDVIILAKECEYYSTANRMLLKANTEDKLETDNKNYNLSNKFYYLYFGLFGAGLVISLVLSLALGTFSVGMMLQTMVGFLFAICPCTIGVAHYLPKLLKTYQLNTEGIIVSNENLQLNLDKFDVFVFDKTGTLTNESKVYAEDGITLDLWKKIYFIEKYFGRSHPIALALQRYFENKYNDSKNEYKLEMQEISANGICAKVDNEKIVIGDAGYLSKKGINLSHEEKTNYTVVYVAIDDKYVGKISIRHELREGMQVALEKLKNANKTLIMLTGDKCSSAEGLNEQYGNIFGESTSILPAVKISEDLKSCIYAEHSPDQKATRLNDIATKVGAAKICFIGDGLNDALCSKKLRKLGGVSISISANDKAAFFTDISLNGSLDYLFQQSNIDKQEQRIIKQNRWILAYGAAIFLVFLVGFQSLGIGVSPLIPMSVMFSTTLFVLFNSYRTQITTSSILKQHDTSKVNGVMQSDLSIGLLVGGSFALVIAVLIASLSSLHLSLPLFVFGGGLANIISSSFLVAATVMLASFTVLVCCYMWENSSFNCVGSREIVDADLETPLSQQPIINGLF